MTALIVHKKTELFTGQIAGIVIVFFIENTKRPLHDGKTEHFKALAKNDNTSAIADHVKTTGHNIKWDHFDILEKGKKDFSFYSSLLSICLRFQTRHYYYI